MAEKQTRIVFMGTPDFARIVLEYLLQWPQAAVAGVYTQPDRPCGRGRKTTPSPVKELALEKGLKVFQPCGFKEPGAVEELTGLAPDYLAVAAYGLILPQTVLDCAAVMPLNVHASLLPKYRGAAPIQRAIINGESATGISIMRMTRGLDCGPVILQRAMGIGIDDTAGSLHDDLAHMGGQLLVEAMQGINQGLLKEMEQDEALATHAPKLTKQEGLIDWNQPARVIHNRIRGMHPWPGAYFDWQGPGQKTIRLHVRPGRIGRDNSDKTSPGTILGLEGENLAIACQDRIYLVSSVKPENSREMDARGFECGYLSRC